MFPFSGACTSILGPAALIIARPSEERGMKKFPLVFLYYFEGFSLDSLTDLKLEKEDFGESLALPPLSSGSQEGNRWRPFG